MQRLSPFDYGGGKAFHVKWIYDHFPDGWRKMHWVDLFGGSGVVTFSKPKQKLETLNDLNFLIWQFWKVLRDHPKELLRKLNRTPISRREYQICYKYIENLDKKGFRRKNMIEEARIFFVVIQQSFDHTTNSISWKRSKTCKITWSYKINQLKFISERLGDVSTECRPALELISFFNDSNSFLFIDPPYYGKRHRYYGKYEMTKLKQHERLAESLINHPGKIILCGIDSENHPYNYILYDWIKSKKIFNTSYSHKKYEETMWLNYEPIKTRQRELF
jgi:DNA adenine methylase